MCGVKIEDDWWWSDFGWSWNWVIGCEWSLGYWVGYCLWRWRYFDY